MNDTHRLSEFTKDDRRMVRLVQGSPLARPEIMREIVDGMVDAREGETLGRCEYEVSKIVDRTLPKIKSRYQEHYEVSCYASIGDTALKYDWTVEDNEYGVVAFHWGFDVRDLPK